MLKTVAIFLAAILIVALTSAGTTIAQSQVKRPVAAKQSNSLDSLFARLKKERHAARANLLSQKILTKWSHSGSASIDLLLGWSRKAIAENKFSVALDLLDQITTLRPGYAEGWNQRATLHFMMKNYGKSIRDIERVLALEPRHYGALSGLGLIFETLDNKKKALEAWYRVLALYPALKSAQRAVIKLEEDISAKGI